MRRKVIVFLAAAALLLKANDSSAQVVIEPKLNVAMAAITVLNPAVEITFGEASAIQFEYFASFSKSDFMGTGQPFVCNVAMVEYRNYPFSDFHKGFFAGIGYARTSYYMSKSVVPLIQNANPDTESYNWGYGSLIGFEFGYKYHLGERLSLELSAAGGWQRSLHEIILDGVVTSPLNATGEWLPYKLGVTLGYRIPLR